MRAAPTADAAGRALARAGLVALVACAAARAVPAAQDPTRATPAPAASAADPTQGLGDPQLERHLDQVVLDRKLALERAWAAADAEARADLVAWFQGRRSLGLGAVHLLSAKLATSARRVLVDGPAADPLQALADSLDLRVQPGAFEATDEQVGEPLIVRVLPLWTPDGARLLPDAVELSLVWRGPDGAEQRALTETVRPGSLRLPGFELYLYAPGSRGGDWELVPEVRAVADAADAGPDDARRGLPVPVPCLVDLHRRFERTVARLPEGDRRAVLEAWLRHGVRDPRQRDLPALIDGPGDALPGPARPTPYVLAGGDLGGHELRPPEGVEERACVVLHSPRGLKPELALGGDAGRAWRAAAAGGVRVVSSAVPLLGGDLRGLGALLAELRAASDRPVVLVVEGGELGLLQVALGATGPEHLDGLVAITVHAPDQGPRRVLRGVPQLSLEPLADVAAPTRARASEDGEPDLLWIRDPLPPFACEARQVPALAEWAAGLPRR